MRSQMSRWLLAAALVVVSAMPALAAGRGWLGVTTQSTDEDLRRGLDLTRDGLLVNQVSDDSPADRAGLRKGDVILTYDGHGVTEPEDLRQLVRDSDPGTSVSLGIWRDGERRTLRVQVGELPESEDDSLDVPTPPTPPTAPRAPRAPRAERTPRSSRDDGETHRRMIINGREVPEDEMDDQMKKLRIEGLDEQLKGMKELKGLKGMRGFEGWAPRGGSDMFFVPSARGRLGVRVEKLNGDLAQALGASGDKGVLVLEVLEDTPAQKAGVRAGDVIVHVGDADVNSPEELVQALRSEEGKVDIVLLRRGTRRTIQAEIRGESETPQWRSDGPARRFNVRIPEPGPGNRVYREQAKDEGDNADLREELRQLRRELRELREQIGEKK